MDEKLFNNGMRKCLADIDRLVAQQNLVMPKKKKKKVRQAKELPKKPTDPDDIPYKDLDLSSYTYTFTSTTHSSPIFQFRDSEFDHGPAVYSDRVTLIAMDKRFEITLDCFHKISRSTRVGKLRNYQAMRDSDLLKVCNSYDKEKREFSFNRDAFGLEIVLNQAATGHLHIKPNICEMYLEQELQYWYLDVKRIEQCCKVGFYKGRGLLCEDANMEQEAIEEVTVSENNDKTWQGSVWEVVGTRKPSSTTGKLFYLMAANIFIVLWAIFCSFSSQSEVRLAIKEGLAYNTTGSYIQTDGIKLHRILLSIDFVFAGLFLLSLCTRFAVCPTKIKFAKQPLNIIDLISTVIFVTLQLLSLLWQKRVELELIGRVVESLRILLLIRLSKASWRAQLIGETLKKSLPDIGLIIYFVLVGLIFVSTVIFYCEVDASPEMFSSLPATIWWSGNTLLTVGYGDMIPKTSQGKILTAFVFILTWMLLAIVIRIVYRNYRYVSEKNLRWNRYIHEEEMRIAKERENLRVKGIFEAYERERSARQELVERINKSSVSSRVLNSKI